MLKNLGDSKTALEFVEWEWLERLNWADLGEDGDFYAEYLVLETDGLSNDDVINQFEALGWLITEDEKRIPVSLGVWIDWEATQWAPVTLGQLKTGDALASDIYRTAWDYWDFIEIESIPDITNLQEFEKLRH